MNYQLEESRASQDFFRNPWKSFTDYIEFSLNELQTLGKIKPINAQAAALMYQGMIREVLILKCMQQSDRLKDTPIALLVDEIITLFMKIIEPLR